MNKCTMHVHNSWLVRVESMRCAAATATAPNRSIIWNANILWGNSEWAQTVHTHTNHTHPHIQDTADLIENNSVNRAISKIPSMELENKFRRDHL